MADSLTMRPATLADADLLRSWRNDPVTRAAFRNHDEVSVDEHLAWLQSVLATGWPLYVFCDGETPIGTGRLDVGDQIELSLTVAPEHRGKHYAGQIIAALTNRARVYPDRRIVAFVRQENAASWRAFLSCGYVVVSFEDGFVEMEAR